METRSQRLLSSIGSLEFYKCEILDLSVLQQLPTSRYFYERYETLQSTYGKEKGQRKKIINDLSSEFVYIWTHMGIPFLSQTALKTKFSKMISAFESLKNTHVSKRGETFFSRLKAIEDDLDVGLDIFSSERIEYLTKELGLEYGKEEEDLYEDNCKRNEENICPRIQ